MLIWQRYLLSQLFKNFLFLFACLFTIYVVVDLSVHGIRFLSQSSFLEVTLFYLRSLSALLEFFFTLTFLLSTMRVLFDLNAHREVVALQMAGLSKKKLLLPFFLFAALLSAVSYLNSQFFAPEAQDTVEAFRDSHKLKKKKGETNHVYSISLEDDSELVYQKFDKEKRELYDVFWIRTPNDIWHMKFLEIDPLRGRYVHHLTRNQAKQMEKTESWIARDFSEIRWNEEAILHRFVPFANRPLSTLLVQACFDTAERSSVFSHLFYKILTPLMPLLVLFVIGPVSLRFSRTTPIFLITACSIFGFIALKVILDGMLILAENQVVPSVLAIFGPLIVFLSFSLPVYVRMR